MHNSVIFSLQLLILWSFLVLKALTLPVMIKNSKFRNPFVGFYTFPHGGVVLDPLNMDYSQEPAFNKVDSKKKAIHLHNAMIKAAEALIQSQPDLIIFSTPHGLTLANSPVIIHTTKAQGNAGSIWEKFSASFSINKELSAILYSELKGAHNPIEILTLGTSHETVPLFWGEVIPWHFITEAAKKAGRDLPEAIYIGQPSQVHIEQLVNVGRDITKTVLLRKEFAGKRIAVVLSGDLSHFHSNDPRSPYRFNPISSVFDKHIVNWAQVDRNLLTEDESSFQLLNKAGNIQEQAGHCGYTGFVMMHGMLEEATNQNWDFKSNVYAYEVPSYFGMMVASWTPINYAYNRGI